MIFVSVEKSYFGQVAGGVIGRAPQMASHAKTNLPPKACRWTPTRAARESKVSSTTLNKRRDDAGIKPGRDGCCSTKEVVRALYSDLHGEQLRRIREDARQYRAQERSVSC